MTTNEPYWFSILSENITRLTNKTLQLNTHSVADGVVRNGGVGTTDWGTGSTEPGGRVKFSLFFDILLILFRIEIASIDGITKHYPVERTRNLITSSI